MEKKKKSTSTTVHFATGETFLRVLKWRSFHPYVAVSILPNNDSKAMQPCMVDICDIHTYVRTYLLLLINNSTISPRTPVQIHTDRYISLSIFQNTQKRKNEGKDITIVVISCASSCVLELCPAVEPRKWFW